MCPTQRSAAVINGQQRFVAAAPLDAESLARMANHQAITLFVARSQDVIVGMLTLVTFPLPSGLRARIEDVVVDQDARGHGIGTALTMAAIDQAQAQGARSIDLTSRPPASRPTGSTSSSAFSSATPTSTDSASATSTSMQFTTAGLVGRRSSGQGQRPELCGPR